MKWLPPAQRAEVAAVVGLRQLRVVAAELGRTRGSSCAQRRVDRRPAILLQAPGSRAPGRAAVRHRALDRRAQRRQVVGQVVRPRAWSCTAIMPQPMSTPTAAGMIAPQVGITEPTVAPMPRCTSGIAAMCLNTNGRRAALRSWRLRLVFHRHAARPHLDRHAAGDFFFDVVGFHDVVLRVQGNAPMRAPPARHPMVPHFAALSAASPAR